MALRYTDASRDLQDRFDTRRLADRLAEVKVHRAFTDADRQFIQAQDMFFLATVDQQGQPTCSYKGGDPGFVTVLDEATLAFPNYDGNGMYLSMGNVTQTGRVGILLSTSSGSVACVWMAWLKSSSSTSSWRGIRNASSWCWYGRRPSTRTARGTCINTSSSSVLPLFRGVAWQHRRQSGSARTGHVVPSRRTIRPRIAPDEHTWPNLQ